MAVALTAALSAVADKVTLKSGSFLTGTADVIRDGVLTFKSDDLGDVEIKLENIASLESDKTHVLKYNDGTSADVALTVVDGQLVAGEQPIDMSAVKETDPEEEKWHGSFNAAYMSSRGNTYNNTASVLFNVNRRWEVDRVKGDLGYYYSKTGTTRDNRSTSANRFEAEGQHDHFWAEKIYSYENARYDTHPLTDATGSRRYICLTIPQGQFIDNSGEIDYEQLYAQVLHEIRELKSPYWFNNDEVARIQELNLNFMEQKDMAEIVEACFRKPQEGEGSKSLNSSQLIKFIQQEYPAVQNTHSAKVHLGLAMKELCLTLEKVDTIVDKNDKKQ